MKVLMITPYTSPVLGGISTYVDSLSTQLKKRKDTFCVVVAEKGGRAMLSSQERKSLLRFLAEGFLVAFRLRPDIIHVQSNWRGFLIALPYKWLFRRTRLFFTFHTASLSPLSGLRKSVLERMLGACSALVFTSSYLLSRTRTSFSLEVPTTVIYTGVSRKSTSEDEIHEFVDKHSLRNSFPVLTYMTAFAWEEKATAIEILGDAIRDLTRHSLSPRLIVLGEGPLRDEVEARISKLGLDDYVVFVGRMSNPFVALSACDIYTHISMKESLSLSILEAMSVGKPVIATDVGGTREIISDESVGVLVSPDSEAIEKAILALCHNRSEMRAVGKKAQQLVEAKFTWDESTEKHLRLYEVALSET